MSERFTKKDAEKALERLCELMGRPKGHYRKLAEGEVAPAGAVVTGVNGQFCTIPGGWELDYNPIYGGYVVEEILENSTGITQPFGANRRSARDFWQMVWDITRAFELVGFDMRLVRELDAAENGVK